VLGGFGCRVLANLHLGLEDCRRLLEFGAIVLQGPHHSAQKSTTTGMVLRARWRAKLVNRAARAGHRRETNGICRIWPWRLLLREGRGSPPRIWTDDFGHGRLLCFACISIVDFRGAGCHDLCQ